MSQQHEKAPTLLDDWSNSTRYTIEEFTKLAVAPPESSPGVPENLHQQ